MFLSYIIRTFIHYGTNQGIDEKKFGNEVETAFCIILNLYMASNNMTKNNICSLSKNEKLKPISENDLINSIEKHNIPKDIIKEL